MFAISTAAGSKFGNDVARDALKARFSVIDSRTNCCIAVLLFLMISEINSLPCKTVVSVLSLHRDILNNVDYCAESPSVSGAISTSRSRS